MIRSIFLFALLFAFAFAASSDAAHFKKAVPFGSSMSKRNLGGEFKDWYLSKFTKNYFCTDTGRLIPVDPESGHMLLRGLRKRAAGGFWDDLFQHDHKTEKGLCHDRKFHPLHLNYFVLRETDANETSLHFRDIAATWVLLPGWTQPIPVTQMKAQYPWLNIDNKGQVHLKEDYREWLESVGAARANAGNNPMTTGSGVPGPGGAVAPDGGVGFVPPSALNVGEAAGFGAGNLGNGMQTGTAAHV